MVATQRWKKRPEGSNWGDFGPGDQLGRLNWLTPERVLRGVAEAKTGRTFCLSLPLDLPGGTVVSPRRLPPAWHPVERDGGKSTINFPFSSFEPNSTDVLNDDYVTMYLQYSTQWDSFAHHGQTFDANGDGRDEIVYYNGYRAGEEIVGPTEYRPQGDVQTGKAAAVKALGIENMAAACVQGRGVMVDLEAHFGRKPKNVRFADLESIMKSDGVVVEKGDFVLFRTGYDRTILENQGRLTRHLLRDHAALDGGDPKLLEWITDSGVVALISDNHAVEKPLKLHAPCCSMMPVHTHCLWKLGVPLGELWLLSELADWLRANRRSRFLLTAPPLRLPGAVGSPVTPVATV